MEFKNARRIKLICLLGLVVFALNLGGCGWSLSLFEYDAVVEAEPAINNLINPEPIISEDGEGTEAEYTLPIGSVITGNPVADVFVEIIKSSGAVDATKTISICIVGDPSAIASFRVDSRLIKKVTTKKRFFVIKTKDSK